MLAEAARRVLRAGHDIPRLLTLLEAPCGSDRQAWQVARDQGWTGMAVPQEHGGAELGLLELGLVAEQCGAVTLGSPFLATGHGAAWAMLSADDPAAFGRHIGQIARGDAQAAIALVGQEGPLTRPAGLALSDRGLSGVAPAVTGGLDAGLAVVWCDRGGEAALALVSLDGARREAIDSFDNSRGHAGLHFDATPAEVLCTGDRATEVARDVLARLALVAAFEQVGGAEAMMLAARDYANERYAFGQPIGRFQSVKHRIAEIYALVELARANCLHAVTRQGEADFQISVASARLSATEAYDTAVRDGIQIHGGIGVTWEGGLHLHMRRARSLSVECGNPMWWEDLLVDQLCGAGA